jgi:hypothetical protein
MYTPTPLIEASLQPLSVSLAANILHCIYIQGLLWRNSNLCRSALLRRNRNLCRLALLGRNSNLCNPNLDCAHKGKLFEDLGPLRCIPDQDNSAAHQIDAPEIYVAF